MLSWRRNTTPATQWPAYLADRARQARDPRLQRYFQGWDLTPNTPIGEAPLVALDMETTGLDPDRHAIVSIGLVPFDLQRIRLPDRRHWLLQPPRPLLSESITLHGITHSDLANAPDLSEVLDELLEALAGRQPVVHYRNIERPFLDTAVRARVGEGLLFPVIDTMELEARRHRQSGWSRLKRFLGQNPVPIRLHDSRLRYGLPAYHSHHAVNDALATAELFQAQVGRLYSPETSLGQLWC
ncbi:3'-5' exonuclease [Alkalilimnicola ehrlichii MLHE-1]|uniref:Exonuclease, RNase T and DNA polymerase III n=1 Tax=Alkalilimnicola ehrlichii (strain ATCC BAA-1101 / DSM 17681 / MLHE-1) TaxID=187272 RepID=Q0AAE7_ALKEH|nr:3'-5' exonuclease [Alkalilimnicola ehrlichii]ABI56190.1 Exonuclease, RNase T and DNA polymerase III [Alkalilimnicola ehrlichii MLHE-1]